MRDRITAADRAGRAPPIDRLICRGHRAVALENLALRQELVALTRLINDRLT
jgi:hypothetical protein